MVMLFGDYFKKCKKFDIYRFTLDLTKAIIFRKGETNKRNRVLNLLPLPSFSSLLPHTPTFFFIGEMNNNLVILLLLFLAVANSQTVYYITHYYADYDYNCSGTPLMVVSTITGVCLSSVCYQFFLLFTTIITK